MIKINPVLLSSTTGYKLGVDEKQCLYIATSGDYIPVGSNGIKYVEDFPSVGEIENSIYVNEEKQTKLWVNSTLGWVDLSIELADNFSISEGEKIPTVNLISAYFLENDKIKDELIIQHIIPTSVVPSENLVNNSIYVNVDTAQTWYVNDTGVVVPLSIETVDEITGSGNENELASTAGIVAYVSEQINAKIKNAIQLVGAVNSEDLLPDASTLAVGTMYVVGTTVKKKSEYIVVEDTTGKHWEPLGNLFKIDLSNYYTKAEIDSFKVQQVPTLPSNPLTGVLYVEDGKKAQIYTGSNWLSLSMEALNTIPTGTLSESDKLKLTTVNAVKTYIDNIDVNKFEFTPDFDTISNPINDRLYYDANGQAKIYDGNEFIPISKEAVNEILVADEMLTTTTAVSSFVDERTSGKMDLEVLNTNKFPTIVNKNTLYVTNEGAAGVGKDNNTILPMSYEIVDFVGEPSTEQVPTTLALIDYIRQHTYVEPTLIVNDTDTEISVELVHNMSYQYTKPLTKLSITKVPNSFKEIVITFKTASSGFTFGLPATVEGSTEKVKFFGGRPTFNVNSEYMLIIRFGVITVGQLYTSTN